MNTTQPINTVLSVWLCALAIASTMLSGCSTDDPIASQTKANNFTALASLSDSPAMQKEKAIAGKDKLFQTLLGELTKSMQANGPAESISVCKTRAPEIATAVGEELGIKIGRTSLQLRNPGNTSPEWAASFVSSKTETPVSVGLEDGKLGVLLPMKLKSNCLLCHGAEETLNKGVVDALAKNYPEDQATGFAEGDLRGYFWVEVDAEAE